MKKMYLVKGMAVLAMGLAVAGCNKLDFSNQAQISEEEALENAEMQLGGTIDPNQDWNMTKDVKTNVSVSLGTGKNYTVYVFNDSPFDSEDAVYYSKSIVADGANATQTITVPKAQDMLYISVFDSDGSSVSKRVFVNDGIVEASFGGSNTRSARRAATRGNNANGNEWADITNCTGYGGWLVPDELTEGQKLRVQKYFQANPGGTYEDPGWQNFFIQQVYKGGTDPGANSTEVVVAADGSSSYSSDNMNELSVGQNHVDCGDFEAGNASFYENVLDNGSNLQTHSPQSYHRDQIELMVDIDDMSCFSYKGIAGKWHDDKAWLVAASVIDAWAAQNGNPGEKVVDKWNRSFMGFDHDLLYEEDICIDNKYLMLGNLQNRGGYPQYVWDGTDVLKVGKKPSATVSNTIDLSTFMNPDGKNYYWATNASMSNGVLTMDFCGWQNVKTDELNADWSECTKMVINFAEAVPVETEFGVETYNNTWAGANIPAGSTSYEVDLTGKNIQAKAVYLKTHVNETKTLKISSISVVGTVKALGGGEKYYESDYVLIDGTKNIQFFTENRDQFIGSKLTGDNTIAVQNNMWIQKDGKTCLNLPKFKEAYEAGYHPTDDNLYNWYKYDGSDHYYSDWIVTLCEAKRVGDEEIHEEEPPLKPAIYSYAFEDTQMGDYDMNDVVLKVKENGDYLDVWLVAAGATLDLEVRLYAYDANNAAGNYYGSTYQTLEYNNATEIHEMWDVEHGTMVNTGKGANATPIRIAQLAKSDGYEADKLRFTIKSATWEVFLAGSGQAPYGVVIPWDWKWPTERTKITKAYNKTNSGETEADQSFTNFMENAGHAELWYKYPTGSVMIVNIP